MAEHTARSDPPETSSSTSPSPSTSSHTNYNIQEFSLCGFLLTNHGLLLGRRAPVFSPSSLSSSFFSANTEPANNNPPGPSSEQEHGEQSISPATAAAPEPSPSLTHSPKSPPSISGESTSTNSGTGASSPPVNSPLLQPVKITPTSSSDEESGGEDRRTNPVSSLPNETPTPSNVSSPEQVVTSDSSSSSNLVPANVPSSNQSVSSSSPSAPIPTTLSNNVENSGQPTTSSSPLNQSPINASYSSTEQPTTIASNEPPAIAETAPTAKQQHQQKQDGPTNLNNESIGATGELIISHTGVHAVLTSRRNNQQQRLLTIVARLLQELAEDDEVVPTMAQTPVANQISALSSPSSSLLIEEEKEEEEEDGKENGKEAKGDDDDDEEGEDNDEEENDAEKGGEEERDDDIDVEAVVEENDDDIRGVEVVVEEENGDDIDVVEEESEEVEDDEEEAFRLSLTTHSAVHNSSGPATSISSTTDGISNTLVSVNANANVSALNEPTDHDQSALPVSALSATPSTAALASESAFASTSTTLGVHEAVTVVIAVAIAKAAAMAAIVALIMENATPENAPAPAPVATVIATPASTSAPTTILSAAAITAATVSPAPALTPTFILSAAATTAAPAPTITVTATPATAPAITFISSFAATNTPAISPAPTVTVTNTSLSAPAAATTVKTPLRSALRSANHNLYRPVSRPTKSVSLGPVTVLGPPLLNGRPIVRPRGFAHRPPFLFYSYAQASEECQAWLDDDGDDNDGNNIHGQRRQGSRKVISRSSSKSEVPTTKDAFSRSPISEGKKRYRSSEYCLDDTNCVSLRDVIVLVHISATPSSAPLAALHEVTQNTSLQASRKRRWGESPVVISSSSLSEERPAAAAERSSISRNNHRASSVVAHPISATPFVPNRSLRRAAWEHPLLNRYSPSCAMPIVQSSPHVSRRWPYTETNVSRCYSSVSGHRTHSQLAQSSVEPVPRPPPTKKIYSEPVMTSTCHRQRPQSNIEDLYDPTLQGPPALQKWINYAQPCYSVLATFTQSLSWTCQRTNGMSLSAWFYHSFWGYQFGFEDYYLDRADDGVVEVDYCGIGSWKKKVMDDDPRKHLVSGVGRGMDEADISASQIKVFGKDAHPRKQWKFEKSNQHGHQVEMKTTHPLGSWKSKLSGMTRLLQEIAKLVPSLKKPQHEEWLDDDDGFAFTYDHDGCDEQDDQSLVKEEGDDDKVTTEIESVLVQVDEAMVRPREEKEDPLARTLLQVIRNSSSWH
ncbi:MAG: hypothetical protein J3R72DRAFT_512401 [Linnemannia gamsii]|nr:MAG: hypothetical protein J3R72DRAFT_512401 [Linnemannia gamsii]